MPTALVIDDEPEANKLLGLLLRLRGCQIQSAFTGAEAFQQVDVCLPDIIFLDLMLPDLNGYEVCKRLKSSKETCLIPLVILTARIADENRIESFHQGADDYIPKPYTPDQIFAVMEQSLRWIERQRDYPMTGEIPFGLDDEGEFLRRLSQLRSLLLSKTSTSLEDASRIIRAIEEILRLWNEQRPSHIDDSAPVLNYSIAQNQLEITIKGGDGWLDRVRLLSENPSSALRLAEFDQMQVAPAEQTLTLVKAHHPRAEG